MSLIESVDSFKKRCNELQEGLFERLEKEGVRNFSTFAFAFGSPQSPVADDTLAAFVGTLFGSASLGNTAIVRRLHFEATTLLLADLKSQAASVDAAEPVRRLPFVEKQSRLERQKQRITGLLHKSDQQPSHSLIDTVFHIMETGALTYVAPSRCYSREQEIQSEAKHKSKQIITIEQGALKSSVSNSLEDVDTSTELKLFFAFQRRHLAFEMMHLLSWEACQLWLDKLMGSLLSDTPSTHASLSLSQIVKADREIFSILAAEHQGELRGKATEAPPLDAAFRRLMHDPRVNIHLVPMPKGTKRVHDTDKADPPVKKIKGADKEKKVPQLPPSLKGTKTKNEKGKPLCWHYNLEKRCSNPVKAGRCRFGYHQCMRCLKTGHGAHECRTQIE